MTTRRARMLRALISTAKQYIDLEDDYPPIAQLLFTPDLDYVFTWEEVEQEFKEILNDRPSINCQKCAELQAENAKLKEAAKAMLAELGCHHRENSPAARKLAALIQEKDDG